MTQYYFVPQRFTDSLRRLQPLVWRLESWVVALILCMFRLLPLRLASALAGWSFAHIGQHTPRARKVRQNLAVAFPEQSPSAAGVLLKRTFRCLGIALVELTHLSRIWQQRDRRIEFVLEPGASRPTAPHRSVFVTAHVGAWALTPLIGPYFGVTIPIIHAPEKNPYVDRQLVRLRRALGSLVARDGGVRVLMRALDQGHSIGLTVDTRLDTGEPLPFFGEDAWTNTVPARLALRYGCDLVPVLAERLPAARYRLRIFPPIRPREPQMEANEQVRDMIEQLNKLFEDWIRARPGEWFCMKRRWPKATVRRYYTDGRADRG